MWAKKLDAVARQSRRQLHYKGLYFPPYNGSLSQEQKNSGRCYYAYYGSVPMTQAQIEAQIDNLIERKLVPA